MQIDKNVPVRKLMVDKGKAVTSAETARPKDATCIVGYLCSIILFCI